MMRLFFILLIILTTGFFILQGRLKPYNDNVPVFLLDDKIAEAHKTNIQVRVLASYKPDSLQLLSFIKDYSNVWAHLNHLYETNDVKAGKEYYTENWFKQLNHHYEGSIPGIIKRNDLQHELQLKNWASDGLVCTVIDSNLVFRYQLTDGTIKKSKVQLEMVLLFQGSHWRIDALRILHEQFL